MANLNIKVTEFDDLECEVVVTYTTDIEDDLITAPFNELFELDMLSAEHKDLIEKKQFSFRTIKKQEIQILKDSMLKMWRHSSGIGSFSEN